MISKAEPNTITLRPSRGWAGLNLRDLWTYRELLYFMVWRDVIVRYKQTLLGASWAILKPFLTMVVFSIFFGSLAQVPSDGIPYPIFTFTALVPWELFARGLNEGSRSLVSNQNMVTKIYFPRLVLPLSSVLAGLVDFAIAFVVLVGMLFYYKWTGQYTFTLNYALLTLPLFLLLALITGVGVSLWLSALNVQYRDINHIIPFLSQFWMFITPIPYSTTLVPTQWQLIYALNPMAGVVNGFRWAMLDTQTAPDIRLVISVGVAVILLISGLLYFRRMERTFADTI